MKPGRELDALVAEKVMGIKLPTALIYRPCDVPDPKVLDDIILPHFSTDIAAAWEVVEKMKSFQLNLSNGNGYWACFFKDNTKNGEWSCPTTITYESAETAPLAICLAALKVMAGGVGQEPKL